MIKKIFQDKYLIFLIIFIVFFLIFTNYRIHETQGWDESRHAVQGHLFYDYFKTSLSGDFMSFRTFIGLYQEKGYNAGWFMFDPPFHAIVQGLIFTFLGASPVTASLATELFMVIGAFLLYFLSLKILHKKYLALGVVILYLLNPVVVKMGGLSMLAVPISFMMVGWYYFTFHREGKKLSIRFSENIKLVLSLNVFIGALFLTAATLMKYQSLIYVAIFYFLYVLYLWVKDRKFPVYTLQSVIMQGIIFFLISIWWIKFSLFDYGMLNKILGLDVVGASSQWFSFSYLASFLIDTLTYTQYIVLFTLPPLFLWFLKRRESFLSKNARLFILIFSIYLVATFLLTIRHFRYMIHAVPFIFILVVKGVDDVSNFIKTKFNFKYLFFILLAILVALSGFLSFNLMKNQIQGYGIYNTELVEYMASIPNPKYLINFDGDMKSGAGYYYNPDLFIFEAMMVNDKIGIHNPKFMQQHVQYVRYNMVQDYSQFANQLSQTSQQIKTIVIIFKNSNPNLFDLVEMDKALIEKEFEKKELTWYYVYEK
ncbi:MAG: hypothetical protein KAT77_01980 [Nanoarchaeota archaeon]|nr:hypothetical protein [Nanoarchaeota archaeon]